MKILQALFFPPEQPGGVSSMVPYIQERFAALQSEQYEMDLFSLPKRIRNKGHEEIKFETFDVTPFLGNPQIEKYLQTYRDYLWWTKMRIKQEYDIIHAHHPIVALSMKRAFPNTKLVLTLHSSYERELILNKKIEVDSLEHKFLTSIYRELELVADKILTVSDAFVTYLTNYVDHPEKIKVIPNGFDEKRFRPIAHENEITQLITVCRLVPAKGIDILLHACAKLKEKGHPFVLHIIGDGPIREELENLARELGLYDDIIFYGYMLHPEEFMPFFDVFVLPSRAEAFGSVFAEAALCQLALIGAAVGGVPEQISSGINGLLIQPEDVDGLVDALETVIIDPDYRYELARAANDKAKKDYSLQRVIAQLKKVYTDLLAI